MLEITPDLSIPLNELQFEFIRASGPGGQNVNKVSSAVQLRFDIQNSDSLPEEIKARLVRLAGKRLTKDGVLVLEARRYRTQEQNRQAALDRLVALIQQALPQPEERRPTRPSMAERQKRLARKKQRSEIKRLRQTPRLPDESNN